MKAVPGGGQIPLYGSYIKIETKYGIERIIIDVFQSVSGCNVDLVDSDGNLVGETSRSKGDKSLTYNNLPAGTYYMYAHDYKNEPVQESDRQYEYLFFQSFNVNYYYKKLV